VFTVALILLLIAVGYFIITTLLDLEPFNNVHGSTRSERLSELRVNAPMLVLPVIMVVLAAGLDLPLLAWVGGGTELVVAAAGISLWWLPYLFDVAVPWGAAPGTSWPDIHARTYAQTVTVVPRIGDRPRPNLEHMVLHTLLVAAGVVTLAYAAGL